MKRRDFLKVSTIGTACVCIGGINSCSMISGTSDVPLAPENSLIFAEDTITFDVSLIPNIDQAGFAIKFKDEERDNKYILICQENAKHGAFLDKCTHGGRELNYDFSGKKLVCSSFGHSKFTLEGERIEGPADAPLTIIPLKRKDNLFIFNRI